MRFSASLPISLATGAAFLLGCNVNLSGANLSANVNADVNANVNANVGNNTINNPPGGGGSGGGGTSGGNSGGSVMLRDVIGLSLSASTNTLVAGALGPFDPELNPSCCYPPYTGTGPQPYPTPAVVGSPIPFRSSFAKIELMALVKNNPRPVSVSPDDQGFSFEIRPNVPFGWDSRQRILWAVKDTPPGELTLSVRWGNLSESLRFQVVAGGAVDVVAE